MRAQFLTGVRRLLQSRSPVIQIGSRHGRLQAPSGRRGLAVVGPVQILIASIHSRRMTVARCERGCATDDRSVPSPILSSLWRARSQRFWNPCAPLNGTLSSNWRKGRTRTRRARVGEVRRRSRDRFGGSRGACLDPQGIQTRWMRCPPATAEV